MTALTVPAPLLAQLSDLIATRLGWYFPPERWHDLERGISAIAQEFGFSDITTYIQCLISSPLTQRQIDALVDHFTIGETYFFREIHSLEILTDHILPPLIRSRQDTGRHLRIWSAACCTGEEAYSIAILLSTLIPDFQDWQITIIGTDINPRFLRKAAEGLYSEWSFRTTPRSIKERYFQQATDGRFALRSDVRQMVRFFPLNLVDGAYPLFLNNTNAMDIILCRNVFIYFSPERARTVIENFYHVLGNNGWLIVSPSETSYLSRSSFEAVSFPGAIVHRKKSSSILSPEIESRSSSPSLPHFPTPPLFAPNTAHTRIEVNARLLSLPMTEKLEVESLIIPDASPAGSALPQSRHNLQAALYDEATTLYEQGRYAEAGEKLVGPLEQAEQQATLNARAMILLIHSYANQGALNEAIEWCRKAIAADQLNPRLYYLLATLLLEQEQENEAVLALKRTLFLDAGFVVAHFALGNLARRQKKTRASRKHFQNALMLLRQYHYEDIVPESEGLTAGRLSELILAMLPQQNFTESEQ